jgi:hypothetical protein
MKIFHNLRIEQVLFGIILGYFVGRGVEFAFTTLPFIPPDEKFHFDLIQLYSKKLGLLNSEDIGEVGFGLVQRVPYLYHYLLGKIVNLNLFPISDLIFLRLINLLFSSMGVFVTFVLANKVLNNKYISIFLIGVLTNIPTYSFISASVSYDNMVNLISVLIIYSFLLLIQRFHGKDLLLFAILCGLGILIKQSMVPYVGIIIGALVLLKWREVQHLIRQEKNIKRVAYCFISSNKLGSIVFILVWILAVELYGGNMIRFGQLNPRCDAVLPVERCLNSYVELRNSVLLREANVADNEVMGPVQYFLVWHAEMYHKLLHRGGHSDVYVRTIVEKVPYSVVLIVAVFGLIVTFKRQSRDVILLLAIYFGYVLFLIYGFNYGVYRQLGLVWVGMQSRYLLPVLPLLLIALSSSLLFIKKAVTVQWIIVLVMTLFIFGDYYYLQKDRELGWTREWWAEERTKNPSLGEYDYLDVPLHDFTPYDFEKLRYDFNFEK